MTGGKKTLTDELRSVLLSHSMDAPEPDETIDWILAQTSEAEPEGDHWWQWRPSGQAMLAAGVVALLVLGGFGLTQLRKNNGSSAGSSTAASSVSTSAGLQFLSPSQYAAASKAAGSAEPSPTSAGSSKLPLDDSKTGAASGSPALTGGGPSCAAIPGGHLVSGSTVSYGQGSTTRYAYELSCVGTNGARSTSEVQLFDRVGETMRYVSTVLGSTDGYQVEDLTDAVSGFDIDAFVVAGPDVGSIVTLHAVPGAGGTVSLKREVEAKACRPGDLTAAVDVFATSPSAVGKTSTAALAYQLITVTNKTTAPCALSGYPGLAVASSATSTPTVPHTLNGPSGGVTEAQVVPIISLEPGGIASAMIEIPAASSRCSLAPFRISLPDGATLIPTTGLPLCDVSVHPFVYNQSGSDSG